MPESPFYNPLYLMADVLEVSAEEIISIQLSRWKQLQILYRGFI